MFLGVDLRLPAGFFNERIGKMLANFVGTFIEYDKMNFVMIWSNFMGVRVCLDVLSPLNRHKVVMKPDGGYFTASFKYERLATFCFVCEILGQ